MSIPETTEIVLLERRGSTSILTFNEPDRINPFSIEMRNRANDLMQDEMYDRDVRAIVISGAGGNFSAGGDIRQMQDSSGPDPVRSRKRLEQLHSLVRMIIGGPKPVIAAVEGIAFGAGLSLVAASDFVVAAEDSRFGASFAKIGLTADCGLLWSLPQRIGLARTKDMMFTCNPISGTDGYEYGLVDKIVSPGKALDAAIEKAAEYEGAAPLSIAEIKFAIAQSPADIDTMLRIEAQQQPMLSMTADHAAARSAFLEKRKPKFSGR